MIQLTQGGAYLVNGTDIVADTPEAASQIQAKTGITISKEEAAKTPWHMVFCRSIIPPAIWTS